VATDADTPEGERPTGGVDRRALIQRAAAAGLVVWTAPVVVESLFSPAAAQTPVAGCFKYMFNWCYAQEVQACVNSGAISAQFDQNSPAPECSQSLDEDHAGQVQTNPNCCQQNDASGNNLQWHQVPDIISCVSRTGAECICPSTGPIGPVTFTVTCPDCYLADVTVLHGSRAGLDSGNCGAFSLSTTSSGGNPFATSFTITFPADRAPVWFKFWVGCGLMVCSPQVVPCTQSDCLPGGQPVANRVLNI
jgi:hypothetical protein